MFNLFGKKKEKKEKETTSGAETSADALQFEILRKLHENANASFNLAQIGLTDRETDAVVKAIDAFSSNVPSGLFDSSGFSPQNLASAKLALKYKTSCDATLYGVISNCVSFQIGSCQGEQKATLEKALKKLADYQPPSSGGKGVYYI